MRWTAFSWFTIAVMSPVAMSMFAFIIEVAPSAAAQGSCSIIGCSWILAHGCASFIASTWVAWTTSFDGFECSSMVASSLLQAWGSTLTRFGGLLSRFGFFSSIWCALDWLLWILIFDMLLLNHPRLILMLLLIFWFVDWVIVEFLLLILNLNLLLLI